MCKSVISHRSRLSIGYHMLDNLTVIIMKTVKLVLLRRSKGQNEHNSADLKHCITRNIAKINIFPEA